METIKRAVIVAAGEGLRLRPVTEQTPKPLIPVNGTRLIDTSINALKKNGIHEICIVAGYRKEQFHEIYDSDPEITVIDNPYYKQGNNITSLYVARDFLPASFVVEGDLQIRNTDVFLPEIEKSAYCGTWMEEAPEWALQMENGRVTSCDISGGPHAYRLWGISMWTQKDGELIRELVRRQFEDKKDWSIYWDQLPLQFEIDHFDIGVREVGGDDMVEIDTFEELKEIDPHYADFETVGADAH